MLESLSELLDDQREALRLYYMKELRVAEVAERMNKTHDSVSSLLQRGLTALRRRMNGEAHEETEPAAPVTAAFLLYLKRREAERPWTQEPSPPSTRTAPASFGACSCGWSRCESWAGPPLPSGSASAGVLHAFPRFSRWRVLHRPQGGGGRHE